MARKMSPHPTDVELEILKVLWERGPSTVGQIHEMLSKSRSAGYSTTLKMVQVMHEKGVLAREATKRPFIYRPVDSMETTQLKMLDRLVENVFDGAMGRMLVKALSTKRATPAELSEIKRLIRDAEREHKKNER